MIPSNSKDKDKLRSLTKSLAHLSSNLAEAQNKAELQENLSRTRIASPETLQFLRQQARVLQSRFLATGRKSALEIWNASTQLKDLISKLPQPCTKEEAEYIKQTVARVQEIAQLASKVEDGVQHVQALQEDTATLSALQIGIVVRPPAESTQTQPESDDQEAKPKQPEGESDNPSKGTLPNSLNFDGAGQNAADFARNCQQYAIAGKTHVSLVAALCLLRTQSLGAASSEGKELMAKLKDVHAALIKHKEATDLSFCPGSEFFRLRAYTAIVCQEAEELLHPREKADEETKAEASGSKKAKKRKSDEVEGAEEAVQGSQDAVPAGKEAKKKERKQKEKAEEKKTPAKEKKSKADATEPEKQKKGRK